MFDKVVNEHFAQVCVERYLGTVRGHYATISAIFAELEREFLRAREEAEDPELTHDQLMLQVYRNDLARALLRSVRAEYTDFILARANAPLELPRLPQRQKGRLDERIEKELTRCGIAT